MLSSGVGRVLVGGGGIEQNMKKKRTHGHGLLILKKKEKILNRKA